MKYDEYHRLAEEELEQGVYSNALWAEAYSRARGDEKRAYRLYVGWRAEEIRHEGRDKAKSSESSESPKTERTSENWRNMRTHYDNLQVSRAASPKVIRAAYKSLVQDWHPDRNPGNREEAERVLKIINKAYDVLSNERLRAEHDRWIDAHHKSGRPGTHEKQPYKEQNQKHQPSSSNTESVAANPEQNSMPFAQPWKRLSAGVVDLVITYVCGIVLGVLVAPLLAANAADQHQLESQLTGLGYIFGWLYFSLFEITKLQATPGKLLLGIKVTDLAGHKVGFGKSTGRHWAKLISAIILLTGFIMIIFTRKKQGLHDIMAGCLVLERGAVNATSYTGKHVSSPSISWSSIFPNDSNRWIYALVILGSLIYFPIKCSAP